MQERNLDAGPFVSGATSPELGGRAEVAGAIEGICPGLVDMAQQVLEIQIITDWLLADGSRSSIRNRHVGLGT